MATPSITCSSHRCVNPPPTPGTFKVLLSGFGKLLAVAPEEEFKGELAKHKHSLHFSIVAATESPNGSFSKT